MDFIWIFWLFLIGWFGFMMYQSYRSRQQRRALIESLNIGEEVTLAGGILGRIVEMRYDRVLIESGPNTRLWVLREAIVGKTAGLAESGEDTRAA